MPIQSAVRPARRLREGEVVYAYDGSFSGFLCCVFSSFEQRELPFDIWPPERETATLFPVKQIETDEAKARRVYASLRPKLGAEAERLIVRDFLSGSEQKELSLLQFLHFAYPVGPGAARQYGHPDVAPLYEMKKSLDWEADKFQGFVRFKELGGVLCATIHPKNYILPLLRGHFCSRFPEESFIIYDANHSAALFYSGHRAELLELAAPPALPEPSAKERELEDLWRQFYNTLEIKARHNERARMTHCPKRFWRDMTEMNI